MRGKKKVSAMGWGSRSLVFNGLEADLHKDPGNVQVYECPGEGGGGIGVVAAKDLETI